MPLTDESATVDSVTGSLSLQVREKEENLSEIYCHRERKCCNSFHVIFSRYKILHQLPLVSQLLSVEVPDRIGELIGEPTVDAHIAGMPPHALP